MRYFKLIKQKGCIKFLGKLLCTSASFLASSVAMASMIVIGSANLKANTLSKNEIASIFLGKINSVSKQSIQPYNQPENSSSYNAFYYTILGWDSGQVNSYWSSMVFSGETSQPPALQNDDQAIYIVEHSNNAIAYVDSDSLKSNSNQFKVLYGNYTPLENSDDAQGDGHFVSGPYGGDLHSSSSLQNAASEQDQQMQQQFESELGQVQTEQNAQMNSSTPSSTFMMTSSQPLWPQIISHFTMNTPNNAAVRHQIVWYLGHRKILNNILNNARPYLAYVYEQTEQRHMPAEFALLPFIESGYDPFAYSHAGALGLWQMMPGTASSYGLDISWWYDGRRDVLSSTQAALDYLVRLHSSLGSWDLAAAAYDAGYGAISAAITDNKKMGRAEDFWSLPLPSETRDYVPKLLAIANIIQNYQRYHVTLPNIPSTPYFSAVKMNQQLDKQEIAELADINIATVTSLNPGMQHFSTAPDGEYILLLPANSLPTFERNLQQRAGKTHISWQYHLVSNNETLTEIAHNYHTSVSLLRKYNELSAGDVVSGESILVPLHLNHTYKPISANEVVISTPSSNPIATRQSVISHIPSAPKVWDVSGLNASDILSGKNPSVSPSIVATKSPVIAQTDSVNQKPITQHDTLKSLVSKLYGQ